MFFLALLKETGTDKLVLTTQVSNYKQHSFSKNIILHQQAIRNHDNQSRVETKSRSRSKTNHVFSLANNREHRLLILFHNFFFNQE